MGSGSINSDRGYGEAMTKSQSERHRHRKLLEREPSELTSAELHEVLRARYAPTEIPPCRICGKELSLAAAGCGPTVWACDGRAEAGGWQEGRSAADEHYSQSRFEDHRRGGDDLVMELLARHEAILCAENSAAP